MATVYPGALDTFVNPISSDDLDSGTVPHAPQHANANDAIKAVQQELGIAPKGTAVSVKARLDAMDGLFGNKVNTSVLGAASGVATLDASSKLVQGVDATKVNSGVLALARLPALPTSQITSGVFGIAQIPSLGAGQTTSGVFAVARIPSLPATILTSGTIDPARLPSNVTANANARVVADIAARDAIPTVDRTDGLIVQVKATNISYVWRADNSTWWRMWDVQTNLVSANENGALSGVWTDTSLWFRAIGGQSYTFDATIFAVCSGSSSVGVRYGMRWTGTGTMSFGGNGLQYPTNSPSINSDLKSVVITADAVSPALPGTGFGLPAGSTVMAQVSGTYVCTASGDVWIQHVQNVSDASFAVTTMAGSSIKAFRVVPS